MKKKLMIASFTLLPLSLSLLTNCSISNNSKTYSIESKETTLYNAGNSNSLEISVFHEKGIPEIVYFNSVQLKEYLIALGEQPVELEKNSSKQTIKLTRNNEIIIFDFANDTIVLSDLSAFTSSHGRKTSIDATTLPANSLEEALSKNSPIIRVNDKSKYEKANHTSIIDLKKYNIDLIWSDNEGYIPIQLISDVILCRMMSGLVYNGDILLIPNGSINDCDELIQALWTKDEKTLRSDALCEFSYNELCLNLDINYGLMKERGISSFNEYFKQLGLDKLLKDKDPVVSNSAVMEFLYFYLDDLHSSFTSNSPYVADKDLQPNREGLSANEIKSKINLYSGYYEAETGGTTKLPSYVEQGDTAFIYFHEFIIQDEFNYYDENLQKEENALWWVEKNDLYGLINYAHKKIANPTSTIKNVVVDLSVNVGGTIDSAAFLVQWLVGTQNNPSHFHFVDSFTSASVSLAYQIDANFDHKFDDKDLLSTFDKNIYVLTSGVSFSCGNAVPALLKHSDKATLIGQKTSGGGCAVLSTSLADGTMFNISGYHRLSTYQNGIYTINEKGVEPDIYISDIKTLYNSVALDEEGNKIHRSELLDIIHKIK